MNIIHVDVAIIGAGTAGLAAYRAARSAHKSAVLIEAGAYGTTCARVGCMPSKLLIAAADAAHAARRTEAFGVHIDGQIEIDGRAVMARIKSERDRFVGSVIDGINRIDAAEKLHGHARFVDQHTVEVGGHSRVKFTSAVIATGSSPTVAPILRGAGKRLVLNDDLFDWDELPASVAVFGPGVIGLELGQALHRLGVKVYGFGVAGLLGPFTDPDIRDYATRTFENEFFLDTDANVTEVTEVDGAVRIGFVERGGTQRTIHVERVLAATGRKPNVGDIGLENTSLQRDARGVPLFDRLTMQCSDSNIFIAGDANHHLPLLHEAADEGRIAGTNAATYPQLQTGSRRTPLAVVFTDPQLAVVGQPYRQLDTGSFVTGVASFEDQGRSRVMRRNVGLAHVYADIGSGKLLGAELIGPDAEHLAHLLAWVMQCELPLERILQLPFYHPVVEEGLRSALRDAKAKLDAAQPPLRQAA